MPVDTLCAQLSVRYRPARRAGTTPATAVCGFVLAPGRHRIRIRSLRSPFGVEHRLPAHQPDWLVAGRGAAARLARCTCWEPSLRGCSVARVTTPAGVSGAVLLLPIQVSVLGVPSPAVTPTNLIFNLFATPSGVLRYHDLRRPDSPDRRSQRTGRRTVPGVVVGAVIRVEWLPGQDAFYVAAGAVLGLLGLNWSPAGERTPIAGCASSSCHRSPPAWVSSEDLRDRRGSFLAPILILGGYSELQRSARRAALHAGRVHRRRRHVRHPRHHLGRLEHRSHPTGPSGSPPERGASSAPTSAQACNPASPSPPCGACSAGSPS